MNKLNTKIILSAFLLSTIIFGACQQEVEVTKIYGKVLDIEQNTLVADMQVNLIIGDLIDDKQNITNPVQVSTTTNDKGEYYFELPYKESQKLFLATPIKKGYVSVRDGYNHLANQLTSKAVNQQDLFIAKGSFLKLHIKKNSPSYPIKKMKLNIRSIQDKAYSPVHGQRLLSELIDFSDKQVDTTIYRGYFYKQVSSTNLVWQLKYYTVNDTIHVHEKDLPLLEHDTVSFEIIY